MPTVRRCHQSIRPRRPGNAHHQSEGKHQTLQQRTIELPSQQFCSVFRHSLKVLSDNAVPVQHLQVCRYVDRSNPRKKKKKTGGRTFRPVSSTPSLSKNTVSIIGAAHRAVIRRSPPRSIVVMREPRTGFWECMRCNTSLHTTVHGSIGLFGLLSRFIEEWSPLS